MRIREIAQVAGACSFVLGSLLACGMTPAKTVGSYRNPVFDGKAPGPTLVTSTVDCSEKSTGKEGGVAADFEALLNKKIGQQQKASVGFQSKEILCSTLATDKMLSPHVSDDEARSAAFWKSRPAFGELTERAGQQYSAKSLLIPIVYRGEVCSHDTETVRDSQGRVVATAESSHVTCSPSASLDIGVFLVSSEGVILWKSTGVLYGDADHSKELDELLSKMPSASANGAEESAEASTASNDDVAVKETSTPTKEAATKDTKDTKDAASSKANASALVNNPKTSAAATDDDQPNFKPVLAKIASNAPDDCKSFAKTSCERSKGPASAREAICKNYVDAVNVVSKQQNSKQTCAAMLKNVPKS